MCDRPALIVLWLTAPSVLDLLASQSNTFFFGDFLFGGGISVHFFSTRCSLPPRNILVRLEGGLRLCSLSIFAVRLGGRGLGGEGGV